MTRYSTQFNLDSDRAFAYLTWDWIRNDPKAQGGTATGIFGLAYETPRIPPEGAPGWAKGADPLELQYKDKPDVHKPPPPPPPPPPPH